MNHIELKRLEDSSCLVADPERLRERFDRDGALLIRGVLDPSLVAEARARFKDALSAEGLIDPSIEAPIWTGTKTDTWRPCDGLGTSVWPKIAADAKLNKLMHDVMNETPVWLPIVAHRSALPGEPIVTDGDFFFFRHQDGFFNEGMNFTQCWIPMMDIDEDNGGLAVAIGQHKRGNLHDLEAPYRIPIDAIADSAWHTVDYRVGDVLVFNYLTPHLALPNRTNQIRLSIDMRVAPVSAPQPVSGTVIELDGTDVTIHPDDAGENVIVKVTDDTFIRDMNPYPRIATDRLGDIAHVGARVLAMTRPDGIATVIRTNRY